MKFKLRQLEAFRAVAETGSMTRAAQKLEISQPAVSRLLSDFSNSVGFEIDSLFAVDIDNQSDWKKAETLFDLFKKSS